LNTGIKSQLAGFVCASHYNRLSYIDSKFEGEGFTSMLKQSV